MMVMATMGSYAGTYNEVFKTDLTGVHPTLQDASVNILGKTLTATETYIKANYQFAAYSVEHFNETWEPAMGELVIYDMGFNAIMRIQFQVVDGVVTVVAIHEVTLVNFTEEAEAYYTKVISQRWENTLLLLKKYNPQVDEYDLSDGYVTGFEGVASYLNLKKNLVVVNYIITVEQLYYENYWTYQLWNSIYLNSSYYAAG